MKFRNSVYAAAASLGLLTSGSAWAHHSFAMFDLQKMTTLDGDVKEFQWTNPHSWVQLIVVDPATGKRVEWSIEGGSPNALVRQGWARSTLKVGDRVQIVIHPLKDGSAGGSLIRAIVNGQTIGPSAGATAG